MRSKIALYLLLGSVGAHGLLGATLAGHVVDPSNAVVPGAALRLRNLATDAVISAPSDHEGYYIFRAVQPGSYNLSVEAPGFEKFVRTVVVVNEGDSLNFTISLSIRATSEQVQVTAKAPNFEEALGVRSVRESSAKDIGEALTELEGVWKVRKGGIANDIVLRGFQRDNINVLVDGSRTYGACPNDMDPAAFHVDFAEIAEVAVTKGAFDVKNQGSLAGIVEIKKKRPPGGLQLTPSLSAGSFGFINPSITASASNNRLDALGGYSFRRSDPYRDGNGNLFTQYANYRDSSRNSSAFDINTGWFNFGIAPWEKQRLEFGYSRQAADHVLYPYLLMDAIYDNADRLSASYDFHDVSGSMKLLRIESYFTQVNHWMTDEYRTSSMGAPRPYGMGTLAGTKVWGVRVDSEIRDLAVGFEAYHRNWNVDNTMRMGTAGMYMDQSAIPDVDILDAGLYADFQRTFHHKLRLRAGGRLDGASSEVRNPQANTDLYWAYKGTKALSQTDALASGNIQVSYPLLRSLEIFAGLGHTGRVPDPEERFFALSRKGADWVGNPDLRPPRNTEVDLGINHNGRWFSVRPTVFYSHVADFITVQNQPKINAVPGVMNSNARSYENVQAKMYGGELTFSAPLGRTLVLLGGLSYTQGTKVPMPADNIWDRDLAEIPPLKTRLALRYGFKSLFGEIEELIANRQDRVDTDLKEQVTPGYAATNIKVGVHTRRLNFVAGIDNIFDRFYYEYCSYQRDPFRTGVKVPEPGRSFYMTASYVF